LFIAIKAEMQEIIQKDLSGHTQYHAIIEEHVGNIPQKIFQVTHAIVITEERKQLYIKKTFDNSRYHDNKGTNGSYSKDLSGNINRRDNKGNRVILHSKPKWKYSFIFLKKNK
jgi:hypothetical protein